MKNSLRHLRFAALLGAAILAFASCTGKASTPDNLNGVPFSLADGVKLFGRPMLGGFNRQGEFNTVSAEEAAALTHKILDGAPKGRVMIGADCTVGSAPLENIKAAIAAAHGQL